MKLVDDEGKELYFNEKLVTAVTETTDGCAIHFYSGFCKYLKLPAKTVAKKLNLI